MANVSEIYSKEIIDMQENRLGDLRYVTRYPNGFSEDKKYPIILFLHGAGTRGNDISKLYGNAFFVLTEKYENFPFVCIAPLCSENTWFDMWERLEALVRAVTELPYADTDRIYVMGASMGGYATWQLGMSMPEYFAAIVPICGGGMYWNAGRLADVSVWAFHGKKDETVLAEESVKMVNAVQNGGGRAKLTLYPENHHDAWSDTYSDPAVFAWLLEQRRNGGGEYCDQYENNPKTYG